MNKVTEIVSKYADRLKAFGIQLSADGEITKEAQMAMAILADGTEVYSPDAEFAVGSELFVMDADGNPMPAPDGEHTTAEGKVIVVSGGVIAEIKEPMEEEPKVEIEIEKEEQAAFDGVSREEFESTINSLVEAFEAKIASLNAEKETLSSAIEKMSKQPAADSVKKSVAVTQKSAPIDLAKMDSKNRIFSIINKYNQK
jgi:BMFP domain-containing protein YqiC